MSAVDRQGYTAGQLITKRLDALGNLQSGLFGVSWWFVRVHLITGGAWAMAAAQTQTFAYMTRAVTDEFPMNSTEKALLIIGATMLGAFLGVFFFGSLADTRGRKFSMLIAFVITHVAGAMCAFSPTTAVLLICRFVVGFGLGGQQPVICALIMELAPTNVRGQALVYINAFFPIGAIFAEVFCREIEPFIGWRAVSLISAAALGYLPLLVYCVPESPKWLAMSGKIGEALRVLRTIEQASSVFHGENADDVIKNLVLSEDVVNNANHVILQAHRPSFCRSLTNRVRILLRFPYLSRTLMLWFVWTVMAMTSSAMCVYLDEDFVDVVTDDGDKTILVYSILVAQVVGNLYACALIDRIGRRNTMVVFLVLASVGSVLEVYLNRTTMEMLITSCLRNIAFMGATGCLFAYTPELYPTSIRVIGIGYAWGISRLGLFAGPHLVFWMQENLNMTTADVMWVFCVVLIGAALVIFFVGIETVDRDVEKAGSRPSSRSTQRSTSETVVSYHKHDDDDDLQLVIAKNNSIHYI